MAARFCAYCGSPVPPGARFCPSCGAAVGGTLPPAPPPGTPPPLTFGAAASYPPPYRPMYPGAGVPAGFGIQDPLALSSVKLAAILGLLGAMLSIVELAFNPASYIGVTSVGSGTSVSVNLTALYVLIVLAGLGLVLTLAELWLYRRAFRLLAPHDSTFSTPATLTLMAMIALVIIIPVVYGLLAIVIQAVQCAGAGNPVTSACLDVGGLLGLALLLAVLAIVLLVGYIGLLIGVWRLGTRYQEGLFKAAAILLIFPYVNAIAFILILVAARSASRKVPAAPLPPHFG